MLKKLFGAGAKPAADDMRATVALNELTRALAEANAAYLESALRCGVPDVEETKAARDEARRELERAEARQQELQARLAEAEAAERKAAAEKQVATLRARRDAVVAKWQVDVAKAYRLLAPILEEVHAVDSEIGELNYKLMPGRGDFYDAMGGVALKRPVELMYERYFFSPHIAPEDLIALGPTKTTPALGRPSQFETNIEPVIGG